ncbi:MAG: carboxymuconolactone decarboxylase family protein [Rhodococcus sp.]|uniref:carboxymuconolactone decarboxylase family protein n=1 Tax=Rhodococcus TaxID=1827 RepID=UPI001692F0EE|nr:MULTISPECIES: carboxymuconolactone decarboxylase family protein [Rhodococcus]NLV78385.1 carboxymuconolactone decarboxylase family protein [Rhodococcus sp. (in: high G+C Gram-positive bacteria)]
MAPRIPPGRLKELGPINWVAWKALSFASGTPDAHLFSTLGRTGRLFRGWLHFSGMLMPFGRLSRFDAETVILRVAFLRGCDYEFDHHTRLGRRAGITDEVRARIVAGPSDPGLTGKQRAMLTAVDELVTAKDLSDETWLLLSTFFDDRRLIEFCLLVTQYDGLATTIGTLRLERDFDGGGESFS